MQAFSELFWKFWLSIPESGSSKNKFYANKKTTCILHILGKGVFTTKPFAKNDFLLEYAGMSFFYRLKLKPIEGFINKF